MVGKEFIEYVEEKMGYRLEKHNSVDLKLKFVDRRGSLKIYMYTIGKNNKIVIVDEQQISKPIALADEQFY